MPYARPTAEQLVRPFQYSWPVNANCDKRNGPSREPALQTHPSGPYSSPAETVASCPELNARLPEGNSECGLANIVYALPS